MKVEARTGAGICAAARLLAIIAITMALAGCAVAMLGGAARSGNQGGSAGSTGSAGTSTRPASQPVSDSAISTAVRSRFGTNEALKTLKLTVDTHDGVVTLRGQVNSVGQRNIAHAEARAVKGVKAVRNELTVK